MKKASFVLLLSVLTGCASLQNAGTAEYAVRPFVTASGESLCCEVSIRNGKEINSFEAHVKKHGDDYSVDLTEQGIKAFVGQEISAAGLRTAIEAAVKAALAAAGVLVLP